MAEVFGVIVGAVSVFGLFKNCVDCFEYIQLGRNFGDDYERYKLRLGIAKFRLERWGVAIGINDDPRFRSLHPTRTDKEVRLIRSLLREIKHLFEDIHHNSRRYQTKGSENLEPIQELNPKHDIYKPSAKLPRPGYSRQWQTGFFKKTAWALYDKKRFEDIMVELSRLLDDLERILTSPNSCRGLVLRQSFGTLEKPSVSEPKVVDSINETPGEPSKSGLKGDAVAADPADVLEQEECGIQVTNDAGGMKVGEEARAHVGNVVKVQMAIQDRTVNKGGNVVVDGKARIQIGNVYGGKSIWED